MTQYAHAWNFVSHHRPKFSKFTGTRLKVTADHLLWSSVPSTENWDDALSSSFTKMQEWTCLIVRFRVLVKRRALISCCEKSRICVKNTSGACVILSWSQCRWELFAKSRMHLPKQSMEKSRALNRVHSALFYFHMQQIPAKSPWFSINISFFRIFFGKMFFPNAWRIWKFELEACTVESRQYSWGKGHSSTRCVFCSCEKSVHNEGLARPRRAASLSFLGALRPNIFHVGKRSFFRNPSFRNNRYSIL